MIYCKTINDEVIVVRSLNDIDNIQSIRLIKHGEEPSFSVYMYDGEYDWDWCFDMTNPSDYERVKIYIFALINECDTMAELGYELDSIFRELFDDILIVDVDECEDCCSCDYCNYLQ